jgi:hypothetical protein
MSDIAPSGKPSDAPVPVPPPDATVSSHIIFETVISPYVSPDDLRGYASASPELAARIIRHNLAMIDRVNAERVAENAHQRECERTLLDAKIEDLRAARRLQENGQWSAAYVVAPLGMLTVLGFAYLGNGWAGAALGTGMVAVVAVSLLFRPELDPYRSAGKGSATGNIPPDPKPETPDPA